MKKVLCLLCTIMVFLSGVAACAESIQPFYIEAQRVTVILSIASDGTATCGGSVVTKNNNTKTNVTLTLKKSIDGKSWSRVTSWSASGSGLTGATVDETYTVSKGYQYKVTVSGKIYDTSGKLLESVSKTSSVNHIDVPEPYMRLLHIRKHVGLIWATAPHV